MTMRCSNESFISLESQLHVQLQLFDVQRMYEQAGDLPITNEQLYGSIARSLGWPQRVIDDRTPIGKAGAPHSVAKRKVRWYQQTLKQLGVIKQVKRGVWQLAQDNGKGLHEILPNFSVVAFSTRLGAALWADCSAFRKIHEPIHLCVTSPPYPLKVSRNYGNALEKLWVDFICTALEPIISNLVPGASVVLNLSNDIFGHKSPARSLYLERTILALHDRLGLHLMDRIPWVNKSKPPAPTYWACVQRLQLAVSWEPILWFTNDPLSVRSNNNRVLEPHTQKHLELIRKGGEQRRAVYGDGAYKLRSGSFGRATVGKIHKNLIEQGHRCSDSAAASKEAKCLGLPSHPAMYPTAIPEFFIKFLTEKNEFVVDPFGGVFKTALAAERNQRRWLSTENILEYIQGAKCLFSGFSGFYSNKSVQSLKC